MTVLEENIVTLQFIMNFQLPIEMHILYVCVFDISFTMKKCKFHQKIIPPFKIFNHPEKKKKKN